MLQAGMLSWGRRQVWGSRRRTRRPMLCAMQHTFLSMSMSWSWGHVLRARCRVGSREARRASWITLSVAVFGVDVNLSLGRTSSTLKDTR